MLLVIISLVMYMQLSDAIRERIKFILKERNMTIWQLYKKTGIPISTLSAFINGTSKTVTLKTLLHICEGFDMKIYEFFNEPIFDDVEQE